MRQPLIFMAHVEPSAYGGDAPGLCSLSWGPHAKTVQVRAVPYGVAHPGRNSGVDVSPNSAAHISVNCRHRVAAVRSAVCSCGRKVTTLKTQKMNEWVKNIW